VRAAVVTVSDGVSEGTRQDESGDVLADLLVGEGFEVERLVVPDDASRVAAALGELAAGEAALVVTTGGTGVAPRDVTPEATASVVERHVPGISEALRAHALAHTPHGMLSRGVAGIRGRTLIVNLPGSPGGARDGFEVLRPALEHALRLIAGAETAHRQT
jgi:molybdopterin adenylyltransferase